MHYYASEHPPLVIYSHIFYCISASTAGEATKESFPTDPIPHGTEPLVPGWPEVSGSLMGDQTEEEHQAHVVAG